MGSEDEFTFLNSIEVCYDDEMILTPPEKKRKKPTITSSWTNESTNLLIEAAESHACIWEYSSRDYEDRLKRDQAWQTIVELFPKQGVDGCKAKWANIKTSFLNVKKKLKPKSGQGAEFLKPHWPFWTAMQFYYQHDKTKTTSSVSMFKVLEGSPPSTSSLAKSSNDNNNNKKVEERLSPDIVIQRALNFLEAEKEVDKWHGVGMYLALQMRELAQKNIKAANRLHAELVKIAMEAILDADGTN